MRHRRRMHGIKPCNKPAAACTNAARYCTTKLYKGYYTLLIRTNRGHWYNTQRNNTVLNISRTSNTRNQRIHSKQMINGCKSLQKHATESRLDSWHNSMNCSILRIITSNSVRFLAEYIILRTDIFPLSQKRTFRPPMMSEVDSRSYRPTWLSGVKRRVVRWV